MTDTPVRLAVIDDFDVIVRGTAAMLADFDDQVAVVELDTDGTLHQEIDVALIDMFGQSEADHAMVTDIAGHELVGQVAIYTWNFAPESVESAKAAGASGYLSKGLSPADLAAAIVDLHHGHQVTDDDRIVGRPEVGRTWPGRDLGLTEREAEVLVHLCQGLRTREIAEALYLGVNSIKTHTQHLYRKIGVNTRTEAALWGIDHGFRPNRDSQALWTVRSASAPKP